MYLFFICCLYLFRQQKFHSSLFFLSLIFLPSFVLIPYLSFSISSILPLSVYFSCIHYCFIFFFNSCSIFSLHHFSISISPSSLSIIYSNFPLPSSFMSSLSITVYSTFPVSLFIHLPPPPTFIAIYYFSSLSTAMSFFHSCSSCFPSPTVLFFPFHNFLFTLHHHFFPSPSNRHSFHFFVSSSLPPA